MRMIDADALLNKFWKNLEWFDDVDRDIALEAILDAPTVDAEPVRHGRWIYHNAIPATCSVCGFSCGMYDDDSSDMYCSHCGAKMDGGAET